jgi:peptidoglycan hydrolase-like amidase
VTGLRRRELLGALAAATFSAATAQATSSSSSSSALVDELYGNRLMFAVNGRPLVPLGMMQGHSRLVVRASGGLVLDVGGIIIEVPGETPVTIERLTGSPGVVRELQVIETLEGKDRSRRRAVMDAWTKRGVAVAAFDVGGVYGVKGTVVDNRAVLIVHDGVLPAGLSEARPVPFEWLDVAPAATFQVQTPLSSPTGPWARVRARDGGAVVVEAVEHSVGYAEHGFEDRFLRDEVLIVPDRRGFMAVVNLVDEDAMVAGVLPSEMFPSAPMEALKAQAVTARGELFAKIGRRHFADPFLVCTEQHCQVYRGKGAEHPRTNDAAHATSGELAFLGGHVVDSVYSACCGGHTEPAEVVWDKPPRPELVGRPDCPLSAQALPAWLARDAAAGFFGDRISAGRLVSEPLVPQSQESDAAVRAFLAQPRVVAWCGRSTFNQKGTGWRWERRFAVDELTKAFADLGVGAVVAVVVDGRGPGGRLRALRIVGDKGEARVLRELPVRKRLGNLKSGLFVIDDERSPDGALVAVVLRGAGFGHGSGMCQQGAIGMAEAGANYQDILAHYYNGAAVRRVF